jgi:hypothetical protein
VEGATITSGIFLVPRVIQKEWEYISKHVITVGEIYPCMLPPECTYYSQIPLVLLYVPFYVRSLPLDSLDKPAPPPLHACWHTEQAEYLHGLYGGILEKEAWGAYSHISNYGFFSGSNRALTVDATMWSSLSWQLC